MLAEVIIEARRVAEGCSEAEEKNVPTSLANNQLME